MSKFNYGFNLANKETAQSDGFIEVRCERTNGVAQFALGTHQSAAWGDVLETSMTPHREGDAEAMLNTLGWI